MASGKSHHETGRKLRPLNSFSCDMYSGYSNIALRRAMKPSPVSLRPETITNTGTHHARHSAGGGCVERTDMSRLVKRQVLCLQMLNRTHNAKLRKAILEYADAELISALCECAHNILRGTVRLTPR